MPEAVWKRDWGGHVDRVRVDGRLELTKIWSKRTVDGKEKQSSKLRDFVDDESNLTAGWDLEGSRRG